MKTFKGKKIIVVIPARGGSKGILKKNIYPVCGKPLIYYAIKLGLDIFGEVIVSTDSQEIADISKKYGAKVIIRPEELAEDDSLVVDALKHVVNNVEKHDLLVLLEPTAPLRKKETVLSAVETFIDNMDDYDCLLSVYKIEAVLGKIEDGYFVSEGTGSNRQKLKPFYEQTGAVYVFKPELIEKRDMFGKRMFPFVISDIKETINIDNLEDIKIAEYYLFKEKLLSAKEK